MQYSKLTKGITLLSFVFFITAFLLYRTGKLDAYFKDDNTSPLQSSANGGVINAQKIDSITKALEWEDSLRKTGERKVLFSSSKSLVILPSSDPVLLKSPNQALKRRQFIDSIYRNKVLTEADKMVKEDERKKSMMYSSKSATIFSPPIAKTKVFSLTDKEIKALMATDTIKKKKK